MQLAPFENSPRFAIFHLKRVVYIGTDVQRFTRSLSSHSTSSSQALTQIRNHALQHTSLPHSPTRSRYGPSHFGSHSSPEEPFGRWLSLAPFSFAWADVPSEPSFSPSKWEKVKSFKKSKSRLQTTIRWVVLVLQMTAAFASLTVIVKRTLRLRT